MPQLARLWLAWLTHRDEDSGTDDRVNLSINVGGRQLLNQALVLLQTARAVLFKVDVEVKGIDSDTLTASSVRLQATGDDAWKPERFFVWGEEAPPPFHDVGIFPLAIEMGFREKLSTDASEGVRSIPLRLVEKGNGDMRINRLLILVDTNILAGGTGTENSLEIQIVSNGQLVVLCEIRATSQKDLERGAANFYTMPVILPFTKSTLTNESITLRIKGGMDNWLPKRFFLFGLDDATGRPEHIVPLVHLQEWPFGVMEPDTTNGIASVTLPLVVKLE